MANIFPNGPISRTAALLWQAAHSGFAKMSVGDPLAVHALARSRSSIPFGAPKTWHGARRNANDARTLGHVAGHDGARSNGRSPTDVAVLQDLGAGTDEDSLFQHDATGKVCSRVDDATAANGRFVSQGTAVVHHAVRAEHDVHGPDHPRTQKHAVRHAAGTPIEDGRWMNEGGPHVRPEFSLQRGGHLQADVGRADRE